MSSLYISGKWFEICRDLLDVTRISRPDTSWQYTDPYGHVHQWWCEGKPSDRYSPSERYELPTLVWVRTGTGYFPDGEPYAIGDYVCVQCRNVVVPRFCPDTTKQYILGMLHYRVDGLEVTKDEFRDALPEPYRSQL